MPSLAPDLVQLPPLQVGSGERVRNKVRHNPGRRTCPAEKGSEGVSEEGSEAQPGAEPGAGPRPAAPPTSGEWVVSEE